MKALLQRVSQAAVKIEGEKVGQIGEGLLIFLGISETDGPEQVQELAEKVVNLRIFPDQEDKMNLSLLDVGGEALVVSQFTLCADPWSGRRPSFTEAADYGRAKELYGQFVAAVEELVETKVGAGRFGAYMEVELVNDGPVTLMVEN